MAELRSSSSQTKRLHLIGTSGNDVLEGGSGNDQLEGESGDDVLDGGQGADILIGGAGSDLYVIDNPGDSVIETVTGFTDIDTVWTSISYILPSTIDRLMLAPGAITGTGNAKSNWIFGNDANNWIDGGGGADYLVGEFGNDTYVVDDSGDRVIEDAGKGTDTVLASVSYTLGANVENLTLTGSAAINGTGNDLNNTLVGNAANNSLQGGRGNDRLEGGAGNDRLDGGAGADALIGGRGSDTYVVDHVSDVVTETSTVVGEIDTVRTSVSYTLGANVEHLILTGTAEIAGTGNELNNTIVGNTASNRLHGGSGNDTLIGGLGDTLTGGTGADQFRFTVVDAGTQRITDFNASEGDRLAFTSRNFGALPLGGLAPGSFRASANGGAADADDRFCYNTTTGYLVFDSDGSAPGAGVVLAQLQGGVQLRASTIVMVAG